ncbi:Acetylcholine receptor subunit alpha-like 2 [Trachymyrmex zeteki]|uniref:Acetylcholine receptor subunit alpha-like 2 n=1 Tax=Mycetomoellerius zeteki TaxID=64791 RepID=A0A151X059_9HYME|nr:Acetylcholine receptor subunit alpha-like 2 [Trachymyrmex zeteki]
MISSLIILILSVGICYSNPDAKRLYDDLLSNYNRLIRPVFNNTDTVVVKLGLRLSQLIDLNLKDQILTTNVWLEHHIKMFEQPLIAVAIASQKINMTEAGLIDLKHINQNMGDKVEVGIDLREYYPSVEWDILGVPAERHKKYYPCCLEPYPDIFFNITLRRKTLFYTVNLIIPCVSISYLSVLAFYLPADSGEKIALCINILLSQTMFFLLISEIIPSTSLALPLLGKYLLFTMILVGFSVVITIIILNVHYRKPSTHKMAPWVRKVFIRRLPKLLLMRVPDDLLNDLAVHKMHGREKSKKKSKFNAAVAAAAQSSIISSPDSARHQRIDGCNGLHRTTAHNRFLVGSLGYNGLPTVMSGLDESLSDVTPRKKYPFELEKALHNVMFIQHHIQRQDEFNAEDQDWGFVAMVLDRLFLWMFTIASIAGTFTILCEAPALYDDTKPIDTEYSSVAQQQYLPSSQELLKSMVL